MNVGGKICLERRQQRGAGSWMGKRRGLARGGVFIFFFLWLGEGKKSKFQFHPSTNQCLLQSIKGEAGPGRFKGAERSGAERVGRRVSGKGGGWREDAQAEKNGGSLPLR